MTLRAARAAILFALLVSVGGCGVRGNLELPEEQKAAETTAKAESGQNKPENAAPKPHKGFILDGLIR